MNYTAIFTPVSEGVGLVPGTPQTVTLEAESDNAAVDAARTLHSPHDDGGDYDVVVKRPSGESVSDFSVRHEPKPHRMVDVTKARELAAEAASVAEKRAALKAEILAEIEAEKAGSK